ncbi:MAG TPA: hypothetical protein VF974_00565 [Patescibacteria group bacterium]
MFPLDAEQIRRLTEVRRDVIRHRAWSNSRHREAHEIEGTPEGDWIAAERDMAPSRASIASLAHVISERRCDVGIMSSPEQDWLEAEAWLWKTELLYHHTRNYYFKPHN